jgi:hypothetical protein
MGQKSKILQIETDGGGRGERLVGVESRVIGL